MHRFFAYVKLVLWACFFGFMAKCCWDFSMWLSYYGYVWTAVFALVPAAAFAWLLLCCLRIMRRLWRGKTTPRLVGRELRNVMANTVFFFKTGGMWTDDP